MQSTLVRVLVVVVGALGLLGGAAFATEGMGRAAQTPSSPRVRRSRGRSGSSTTASACRRTETALKWNVSGPRATRGQR